MKTKVQAQHLMPGDVVGSGETVVACYNSLANPPGKITVALRRTIRDKDGQALGTKDRSSYWGKWTMINAERANRCC
jgi:hypothetical protein